jgi:hypothetical protein
MRGSGLRQWSVRVSTFNTNKLREKKKRKKEGYFKISIEDKIIKAAFMARGGQRAIQMKQFLEILCLGGDHRLRWLATTHLSTTNHILNCRQQLIKSFNK